MKLSPKESVSGDVLFSARSQDTLATVARAKVSDLEGEIAVVGGGLGRDEDLLVAGILFSQITPSRWHLCKGAPWSPVCLHRHFVFEI